MYVAAVLFWVSGLVTVVVSLCTDPPSREQIATTTLWGLRNRIDPDNSKSHPLSVETKKEKTMDDLEIKPSTQDIQTGPEILPNDHLESQQTHKQQSIGQVAGDKGRCAKCEWFCGYNKNVEEPDSPFGDEDRNVTEMLKEPPKTTIILNLGLLLVCALGIFLFVFFSL